MLEQPSITTAPTTTAAKEVRLRLHVSFRRPHRAKGVTSQAAIQHLRGPYPPFITWKPLALSSLSDGTWQEFHLQVTRSSCRLVDRSSFGFFLFVVGVMIVLLLPFQVIAQELRNNGITMLEKFWMLCYFVTWLVITVTIVYFIHKRNKVIDADILGVVNDFRHRFESQGYWVNYRQERLGAPDYCYCRYLAFQRIQNDDEQKNNNLIWSSRVAIEVLPV